MGSAVGAKASTARRAQRPEFDTESPEIFIGHYACAAHNEFHGAVAHHGSTHRRRGRRGQSAALWIEKGYAESYASAFLRSCLTEGAGRKPTGTNKDSEEQV
jgi:hypothetical protein